MAFTQSFVADPAWFMCMQATMQHTRYCKSFSNPSAGEWLRYVPVKLDEVEKKAAAVPDCPDCPDLHPTYRANFLITLHWLKIQNSQLAEPFDELFALEIAPSPFEYHYMVI